MGQETGDKAVAAAGARLGAGRCRLRVRSLVAMVAVTVAGALCSSSAQALTQQGHVYETKFGEEQGLSKPSAVAVDESTGDVYVLDTANNRVMVYGPKREFLEAWGYGVETGGEEFQRCTKECRDGLPGYGKGQFDSPVAIAVDNAAGSPSHGDVYVLANGSPKKAVVDEFTGEGHPPAGRLVRRLITKEEDEDFEEEPPLGVAVTTTGTVWVAREEEEDEFDLFRFSSSNEAPGSARPAEEEVTGIELPEEVGPARPGFAVDANGDVYVTYEPGGMDYEERLEEETENIPEREKERKEKHEELKHETLPEPCEAHHCYVAKFAILSAEGSTEGVLVEELGHENTTGVAVDLSHGRPSSGDVYLDNATSVAAFAPSGESSEDFLFQRFGADEPGAEPLQGGRGIAVDADTNEVFVPDASAARVDVYGPEPKKAPTVSSLSATTSSPTAAELRAQVDPEGLDTHYYFEYGTASCAEGACIDAPAKPGQDVGNGFEERFASVAVEGLSPDTTYHFRLIATNEDGSTESVEATFTTAQALPDGRAWELVSPEKKDGATIEGFTHEGGIVQAAADGEAVTYLTSAPVGNGEPEGNRGPEPSQILAHHEADGGWASQDIATGNTFPYGIKGAARNAYQAFSRDLSVALLEPEEELSKPAERTFERTVYLRADAPIAPEAGEEQVYKEAREAEANPGDLPLMTVKGKSTFSFEGATSDLSHVLLFSPEPQLAGAGPEQLYEWCSTCAGEAEPEPGLQVIGILPNEEQAPATVKFAKEGIYEGPRNAVSEACGPERAEPCSEGDRVVFYDTGTRHLYMRELEGEPAKDKTLRIDAPNDGSETSSATVSPVFQTANTAGTKVFFTDPQKLAENALDLEPSPENEQTFSEQLYVFEPDQEPSKRVTDITPTLHAGEIPEVLSGVIGASEDGSTIYYVANGVLATNEARGEQAERGRCGPSAPREKTCNLYVSHDEGGVWKTTFIAQLSNEDFPDWGETENIQNYDLYNMTSRVSPNGQFVAFMSDQSLTGYDNIDAVSGERDEEVFLYDAQTDHLVCASCDPSGARPYGVHDIEQSGEGRGLLVDRPETWAGGVNTTGQDSWLAANVPGWTGIGAQVALSQSRYLSDKGRLFFNSSDPLVPQAVNRGTMDVYEYEPEGVGGCSADNTEEGCVALISSGSASHESAFVEASENGDDVFFLTTAKLSPLDDDSAYDLYDARVCPEAGCVMPPVPSESSPCSGESECRPGSFPPSTFEAPASEALNGSGNIAVLGKKEEKKPEEKKSTPPPKLTKKQLLEKALKACKKDKKKHKRLACEKAARKKYGAAKASKSAVAKRAPRGSDARTRR